ncbi:MAG: sigma-70 family RNA polymerase sigma factor [Clostridia bacterium]|nr:sigma-70 family RNA polymerase sigma factor [Clostridia bacterium]
MRQNTGFTENEQIKKYYARKPTQRTAFCVINSECIHEPRCPVIRDENDLKVARALKSGDEKALEKIIGRYSGYTAAIVMNIIGAYMAQSDVEEVCSDVFLALWKNREAFAPENLKGYLATIARSRARNKLRELRRCQPLDDDVLTLPGDDDPEGRLTQAEEAEALNSALNALNERDRDVFIRHYYLYQTTADISRETGINRDTVKTILKSGREKLKKTIMEGGRFLEYQNN